MSMSMSFLKRLPLIQQLLLVLVPVSLIVSVLVAGEFHRRAAQSIEDSTSAMMAASNDAAARAIADLQDKALVIASIFANLDFVAPAYRSQDETIGSDRLKAGVARLTASIIAGGDPRAFKIHYHKSPARSFMRSWTSKRFDDLSGFRRTILEVNRTHKPLKAIEFGVAGFAIRGIAPVFDGGDYLGSCEFLYDIHNAYDLASHSSNSEVVFLVKKSVVRNSIKQKDIDKQYKRSIEDYYLSNIHNKWVDPTQLFDRDTKKVRLSGDYGGVFFNAIPIQDNYGMLIGYSVNFVDDRAAIARKQHESLMVSITIFAVLAAGCLLIVFFVNVRMIRPIKRASRIALEFANGNLDGLQIGTLR
jgi:methyl-accepting chemotaxis protein